MQRFSFGEGLWGIDAGVGFRKCMYVACGGTKRGHRTQNVQKSSKNFKKKEDTAKKDLVRRDLVAIRNPENLKFLFFCGH